MKNKILSIVAILLINLSIAFPALSTPIFNPDRIIYIDAELQSHPTAPVNFEAELTNKLRSLTAKTGINYYVWATQVDANASKPVGVRKADELIAAWAGAKDFPADNYNAIVWGRYKENPAKGGIGINGDDKNLIQSVGITPILKQFMPANSKGAILAIAEEIHRQKERRISASSATTNTLILLSIVILLISFGFGIYNFFKARNASATTSGSAPIQEIEELDRKQQADLERSKTIDEVNQRVVNNSTTIIEINNYYDRSADFDGGNSRIITTNCGSSGRESESSSSDWGSSGGDY